MGSSSLSTLVCEKKKWLWNEEKWSALKLESLRKKGNYRGLHVELPSQQPIPRVLSDYTDISIWPLCWAPDWDHWKTSNSDTLWRNQMAQNPIKSFNLCAQAGSAVSNSSRLRWGFQVRRCTLMMLYQRILERRGNFWCPFVV